MNSLAIPLIEKKVGALFKDLSQTHTQQGKGGCQTTPYLGTP